MCNCLRHVISTGHALGNSAAGAAQRDSTAGQRNHKCHQEHIARLGRVVGRDPRSGEFRRLAYIRLRHGVPGGCCAVLRSDSADRCRRQRAGAGDGEAVVMSHLGWLFNPGVMWLLANGLATTILLAVICGVLSFVVGNVLALARMSRFAVVRYPAVVYIEIVRALPLLLFIFAVYFLSQPIFGIN